MDTFENAQPLHLRLSREAWSMAFQMMPGVGDLYSAFSGLIGFDPIAGRSLSDFEKVAYVAAGMLPFVTPGMTHLGGSMLRNSLDELPAQRFGDELAGLSDAARYGDEFGPVRPLTVGPTSGLRQIDELGDLPRGTDLAKPAAFETYYRAMSHEELAGLQRSGALTIRRTESFVTPSRSYVEMLAARSPSEYPNIVAFEMAPGTTAALE